MDEDPLGLHKKHIDLHKSEWHHEKKQGLEWGLIGDALLHIVIAVVLTYFFFTPGKEAISTAVKSLIQ